MIHEAVWDNLFITNPATTICGCSITSIVVLLYVFRVVVVVVNDFPSTSTRANAGTNQHLTTWMSGHYLATCCGMIIIPFSLPWFGWVFHWMFHRMRRRMLRRRSHLFPVSPVQSHCSRQFCHLFCEDYTNSISNPNDRLQQP